MSSLLEKVCVCWDSDNTISMTLKTSNFSGDISAGNSRDILKRYIEDQGSCENLNLLATYTYE